jgi:hypothetical protein
MWQDYVISVGSFFFIVALIPSIISKDKPSLLTSVTTALILFIFSMTYVSLSLWFAATTTAGTSICWSILAMQKYRQKLVESNH